MPMPPPADDFSRPQEGERGRLEMERNFQLSQENVLPLETAWNEGRFYGLALKGSQQLTGVQRVGIFMLGFLAIAVALMTVIAVGRFHGRLGLLSSLFISGPFVLLEFALGFRLCWVAIKRAPHHTDASHRHHHAK
jgi:hypothetical protein